MASASRKFDVRVAIGTVLLLPTIWFTWLTVDGLAARRKIRTDLAEMDHVRYGLVSADNWRAIVGPILHAQVDKLDLKAQGKNLKPTIERALNTLLDAMPQKMKGGNPLLTNPLIVNMIVKSLKPHVPEYADVVMAELAKPENQKGFKESIRSVVADAIKNTFARTDMTTYSAILKRYGCANGDACEQTLRQRIDEADGKLNLYYRAALGLLVVAFVLLMVGRPSLSRASVVVLMLFCITVLVGGVASPMLEVEVRISRLNTMLLGAPVEFREQSLYFRSKTVFEVSQTLFEMHRAEMTIVAVLVLLFSVVFPALKMLSLSACVFRPALLQTKVVKFLAFDSSKWSMADVMALAIFMSFVAFNGVIESGMDGLRGAVGQLVIPTQASKILPGYYLFIGFCLASIFLSKKLERGIASGS